MSKPVTEFYWDNFTQRPECLRYQYVDGVRHTYQMYIENPMPVEGVQFLMRKIKFRLDNYSAIRKSVQ